MPSYSRLGDYSNGSTADGTEITTEFDNLYTAISGGLDEDNISPSAQIANSQLAEIAQSKVADHGDTAANYALVTSPGDSGTPSLPSNFLAENQRLRYRIAGGRRYLTNVRYMDASAVAQSATWYEPPAQGPNLLPNSGFETHTAGTPNAPNGWSLVSTPATVALEAAAFADYGLSKRSLNIVTNGANEGISTTVAGLKSGAKYLVGMVYTLTDNGTTPGALRLSTTGGLASGAYQNLVLDASLELPSSVGVLQGIVKAQTPAVTMTISITATESGADFNILEVWMYELSESYPIQPPSIPVITATDSTQDTDVPATFTSSQWNWESWTPLSLSQYVPFAGYRLIYETTISYHASGSANDVHKHAFRIRLDTGGGYNVVSGPFIEYTDADSTANFEAGHIITLRHIVDNPTPGLTYAFEVQVGAYNGGSDHSKVTMNPLVNSLQSVSTARLVTERL